MQVQVQNGSTTNNGQVDNEQQSLSAGALGSHRKSSIKKVVKEEVLYTSNSIQLSSRTVQDEHGKEKKSEVIHKRYMVGRNSNETNTILSIATLKRHILCDCLVLVKQYRPTLKAYVLEFPARIIEHVENERSGDYAIEDLKDNTGYGSTVVKHVSPETAMDPELCDSKLKLVSMVIDGDDPFKNNLFESAPRRKRSHGSENGDESQSDDEDDFEVIQVPINGLLDRLTEYNRKGIIIDSRVYTYAMGMKLNEKKPKEKHNPENIDVAI